MPDKALTERLHTEIVVQCDAVDCGEVFVASEAAHEPIESWAERASAEAEAQGWSVSSQGVLLCPKHGSLAGNLANLLLHPPPFGGG